MCIPNLRVPNNAIPLPKGIPERGAGGADEYGFKGTARLPGDPSSKGPMPKLYDRLNYTPANWDAHIKAPRRG